MYADGTDSSNMVAQSTTGSHNLTKEQYDHLVSLLQQSKITPAPQEFAFGSANFAGFVTAPHYSHSSFIVCNFSRREDSP